MVSRPLYRQSEGPERSWDRVGRAETKLNLVGLGGFDQYDFHDLSPAALADGEKIDVERGLSEVTKFVCGDIHTVELQFGSYDVITFIASLHHMDRLRDVLAMCARLLAPGGVLWAVEYSGPDHFQLPDHDTDFVRALRRERGSATAVSVSAASGALVFMIQAKSRSTPSSSDVTADIVPRQNLRPAHRTRDAPSTT